MLAILLEPVPAPTYPTLLTKPIYYMNTKYHTRPIFQLSLLYPTLPMLQCFFKQAYRLKLPYLLTTYLLTTYLPTIDVMFYLCYCKKYMLICPKKHHIFPCPTKGLFTFEVQIHTWNLQIVIPQKPEYVDITHWYDEDVAKC